MIELVGYAGSFFFACCAIPQALTCYKQGHGEGLSVPFLGMWFSGEILTIVYACYGLDFNLVLLSNYVTNLLFLAVIIKYKFWPRK